MEDRVALRGQGHRALTCHRATHPGVAALLPPSARSRAVVVTLAGHPLRSARAQRAFVSWRLNMDDATVRR
jgi:uncharacterized metal-binding protein